VVWVAAADHLLLEETGKMDIEVAEVVVVEVL
jgi:hypothetical protein